MAVFGKTTNGADSIQQNGQRKVVSKATPSSNGTVTSLTARIWRSSANPLARAVIYADNAGAPGALLATSDELTISNSSEAEITFTFSGGNQISIVSGTPYWIGILFDAQTMGFSLLGRSYGGGESNAQAENVDTYSDGASDPFGTPTYQDGTLDAYVTYTEEGSPSASVSPSSSVSPSPTATVPPSQTPCT